MENISVLTDFPQTEPYYKKISSDASGHYTIFTGGNYVFVCNEKNRAIRFTGKDIHLSAVTQSQIEHWLERLQKLFPGF